MVERLKSISRTTPWSSLLKALAFALGWAYLPSWGFVLLALGLYLIPIFRPLETLFPFATLLGIAYFLDPSVLAGILLLGAFFLILGIKDLTVVNRDSAYEAVFFIFLFLLLLSFFEYFNAPGKEGLLAAALGLAFLAAFLFRDMIRFFEAPVSRGRAWLAAGIFGFLLWQWSFAMVFLPLNHYYSTALLFLGAASVTELIRAYLRQELDRRTVLSHFSVFFAAFAVILALTPWTV